MWEDRPIGECRISIGENLDLAELKFDIMGERLYEELELAKLYEDCRLGYKNIGVEKEILLFLSQSLAKAVPYLCAVDVGCGTGLLTRVLAPYFTRVIGVDISLAQIQVAREATKDASVEYKVGPGEDLSFLEDESVELVTAAACIHYFNTDRFFKEVDRVLKPGGCLAIISNGRNTECFTLTPVTKNQDVLDKCNRLMKEVLTISLHQFNESSRNVLSEGWPDPKNYKDVHRFTVTTQKEGSIDILVGLLNSFGTFWRLRQENPNDDAVGRFRERFLEIFREISPTPEEVQVILASPLHCSLYRKPL